MYSNTIKVEECNELFMLNDTKLNICIRVSLRYILEIKSHMLEEIFNERYKVYRYKDLTDIQIN